MKKSKLLVERRSKYSPGRCCFQYEDFSHYNSTWIRVAFRDKRNLLWIRSGKSFFELKQYLKSNEDIKIWVSLAEYDSPNFDTAHISFMARNLFYIPKNKDIPHIDESYEEVLTNFIDDTCKFHNFPRPNAMDYQSDGCYVSWVHKRITNNQIDKWRRVQEEFREMFSFSGEYPIDPNYMIQCSGPGEAFEEWGYNSELYPIYSFAEE